MLISLTEEQKHLVQQVQHNCDISDANHAGNYTLCIYLLKMREYYRWLNDLDFTVELDSNKMSHWLRERENIWDQVADQRFKDIQLGQNYYDAFDTQTINTHIQPQQLFYHAGVGQKLAHHFFIAELIDSYFDESCNTRVTITGAEFARDLTAPPAISNRDEIIIRQESLKRLCWERYQEWNWNRYDNPMGTALSFYPFDESIGNALQQMVEVEQHTLIQHELGEMRITRSLGDVWPEMMMKIIGSKAELLARSVRDHLADCISTLPYLIEQKNSAALHFYFANLTYMRKQLFPSVLKAYQQWSDENTLQPISEIAEKAIPHWESTLQAILNLPDNDEKKLTREMVNLIEESSF